MPETLLHALAELVTELLGQVVGGVIEAVGSTASPSSGGGRRRRRPAGEEHAIMARGLMAMAFVDDGRVAVAERQVFRRLLERLGVDDPGAGAPGLEAEVAGSGAPADVVIDALEALGHNDARRRLLWGLVMLGLCEGGPAPAPVREVWRRARDIVTVDDDEFARWVLEATRQGEARARRRGR